MYSKDNRAINKKQPNTDVVVSCFYSYSYPIDMSSALFVVLLSPSHVFLLMASST